MSRFIQLHILTSYPAANLNRDDLGAPKSMRLGETNRLRVSSQSLKRAWRTSDAFKTALGGDHLGTRTKELGRKVFCALTQGADLEAVWTDSDATGALPVLKEKPAAEIARAIGGVFGKLKAEPKTAKDADAAQKRADILESLEIEQLAHVSREERDAVANLVEACRVSGKTPEKDSLDLLRHKAKAADIAMFGRMLAASARYNVEAAVQVAHAVTVHRAVAEDDFFTAVDDLNRDDAGAGHMGVSEFGAGVYYLYVCIDRDLLTEKPRRRYGACGKIPGRPGDRRLHGCPHRQAGELRLTRLCLLRHGGKRRRHAAQPLPGVSQTSWGGDGARRRYEHIGEEAVAKLIETSSDMNEVYGQKPKMAGFNVFSCEGSLEELVDFVSRD